MIDLIGVGLFIIKGEIDPQGLASMIQKMDRTRQSVQRLNNQSSIMTERTGPPHALSLLLKGGWDARRPDGMGIPPTADPILETQHIQHHAHAQGLTS